ncbi:cysteine and histidine-rich domain-containing protein RAR1-like [Olea europaea var. sylvestris]|uniref:cysteine and histidine-rich domain-containing protein RAR1-like n=1 Tax=Olea europaea var. sylvestris TaxID=158386 RepID=UPI000C1CE2AF|nr:cysteine and histidine-rich domain-containing protein RAR1-like [Olea europaea var. sylvestris]
MERVRCQRIGCNAMFTVDDNPDGSCTYHDADKFRRHLLQLDYPFCKTGKHTTEKPVLAARPKHSAPTPATNPLSKHSCLRCQQGFFCSDHGSQTSELNPTASNTAIGAPSESNPDSLDTQPPPAKKIVDINQPQTCRNKGCGKTFKEKDNHDTACSYHPGPAIFHDRVRGWKCCDVHVKEFEEFMNIPPCTKGWHNADPVS